MNMNTSPSDLNKWKVEHAKACYMKLFSHISEEDKQVTYMSKILEKVWSDADKASETSIAFAISICEAILNPNNESIQIKEEVLRKKLRKNKVCFTILCKYVKYLN